ncbi:MAG: hypothetical protein C5B47_07265 [Verrucomicrobia bacterium]|nr:MAG: hypothetical protein C5B47_07265 [Verrucomicrobiota bacterium]
MRQVLSLLVVLTLTSCYHLGEIRPTAMRAVRTLAIPTFRNTTLVPRTEVLLANITIRAFQTDGTYRIVPEDQADAILQCRLTDVSRAPILSSTTNIFQTQQFQLQIQVQYDVIDRITGSVLQSGAATGQTTYFVGADRFSTFVGTDLTSDERQALPLAGHAMAISLMSQLTQGW